MARDPDAIAGIRKAIVVQRGEEDADDLMEMLQGYSPADVGTTRDEVKTRVLERLLTWMDHEDLIYRVVASHNMNEITGTNYLGGYRPEHTDVQRRRELKYY